MLGLISGIFRPTGIGGDLGSGRLETAEALDALPAGEKAIPEVTILAVADFYKVVADHLAVAPRLVPLLGV